ncbi:MAG: glycosyltransferase family 2 protein [Acidimicrobiaceae bacterium]|nr:glycosyltransferase family 2 protein [Acidimicrobiaceae bacterium]
MTAGVTIEEQQPLVSVLVVSHNVRGLLLDTLRALANEGWPNLEVIVVDNESADGSAEAVGLEFPQTELIALTQNLGYGRANNVAFERAKGDLILLLNPDVVVSPGCVGHLVRFLQEHADAGAVGPRLVRQDGSPDLAARRSFPTPLASFYRITGLSRLFPASARFNRYNLGAQDAAREHEMDAGTGACLMIRRSAIDEVGLFDPDFFMYGEDLDLCYRIKAKGWKVWYAPGATAVHVKGTATRQVPFRMRYEFHRAMWVYHCKHHAAALPPPANAAIWLGIWGRWAVLTAHAALTRDPRVSR